MKLLQMRLQMVLLIISATNIGILLIIWRFAPAVVTLLITSDGSILQNENSSNSRDTDSKSKLALFPRFSLSKSKSGLVEWFKPKSKSGKKPANRKMPKSNVSTSYILWSREPDSVDWDEPMELCESMMKSENEDDSIWDEASTWTIPHAHDDMSIVDLLSNCERFFDLVPFRNTSESVEESSYPLAYVLVGAINAAQLVRLFRMIYHPQNAYCLVYDESSTEEFKLAVQSLVKCFSEKNVYLNPEPEIIGYSIYALLHSEISCLKVLLEKWKKVEWKYVQIISWNDFPLKTNSELVKIFKIFNGSQDSYLTDLTLEHFAMREPPAPLPDGLTIYKGSHATSMTKEFVEFSLTNPTANKLSEWLKITTFPEEYFWSTIIHNINLHAPGAFPGQCQHFYSFNGIKKYWASRYEAWASEIGKCRGTIINWSCVFGVRDLPILFNRPEFVVHKIYEEFQSATNFCLEKWYWEKVRKKSNSIDTNYYENFQSVRYHHLEDKQNFTCL